MAVLAWSESLQTGIGFIDESHRRILDLIGEVSRSGDGGLAFPPSEAMALLTDYTGRHFQEEEELMAFLAYPDLPAHRAEHQRALGWIGVLQAQAAQGLLEPRDITAFAREFVEDHILTQDMPFIRWARSPQSAQALAERGAAQDLGPGSRA